MEHEQENVSEKGESANCPLKSRLGTNIGNIPRSTESGKMNDDEVMSKSAGISKDVLAPESQDVSKVTDKERNRHILLVTGLSPTTGAQELKSCLRKYDKIGRIEMMLNTRDPESPLFAHVTVKSLDKLNYLLTTVDGIQLNGKTIRVFKAPEEGLSLIGSYKIAVAVNWKRDGKEDVTIASTGGRGDKRAAEEAGDGDMGR